MTPTKQYPVAHRAASFIRLTRSLSLPRVRITNLLIAGLTLVLAGCATGGGQWTRAEQAAYKKGQERVDREVYGDAAGQVKKDAIELQLMIRRSQLPPESPRLAEQVWKHFQASRQRWLSVEKESHFGYFPPKELYDSALAYFNGIGKAGRVLDLLAKAVNDAERYNAMGFWRRYQVRLIEEAIAVGNGPLALRSLDTLADRFMVNTAPKPGLSREDRAWTAYLLSQRYAATKPQSLEPETVKRDAGFVLETIQSDDQFHRAYLCCGVPAVDMLQPLLFAAAKTRQPALFDRLNVAAEEAKRKAMAMKREEFGSPPNNSPFGGFAMIMSNELRHLLSDDVDNHAGNGRFVSPYQKSWPLFQLALTRWEAAYVLERVDQRSEYLEEARRRMQILEEVYSAKGDLQATADGLVHARYHLRLAGAIEDELTGNYDEALQSYQKIVSWSENVRDSLPADQRLYFFQGNAKPAYLGLIRTRAAIVQSRGGGHDNLLAAIQNYRGRQLLEQIPDSDQNTLAAPSVAELQADIGPDELRLVVLDLDTTWLSVLVDKSDMRVVLQPQASHIRGLARQARQELVKGGGGEGRERLLPALLGDEARRLGDYASIGAITDGLVSLVPLEALYQSDEPLVVSHRIRYFPTLAGLDSAAGGQGNHRALIVANPDFKTMAQADTTLAGTTRNLRAVNAGGYFTPLPETMEEAAAVEAALPDYQAQRLSGQKATESAVREALAKRPGLVHFATHGILSGELPGLTEAALVLADSNDSGSDGLLTASEIAELDLDARLAVLSACNTGNGEQIAGEGLVGVSRAFLSSGTEGVVASLWPVDSQATVRLMETFYSKLGEGLKPAEALRQAKLILRKQQLDEGGSTRALQRKGYSGPGDGAYYWSPFILVTLGQ